MSDMIILLPIILFWLIVTVRLLRPVQGLLPEIDIATLERYLGPCAEWESLPLYQLDERFRQRGWGVLGTDSIEDTTRHMLAGTLPTLAERMTLPR